MKWDGAIAAANWSPRPTLGFKSFEATQGTLVGIEFMPMRKKGQMVVMKHALHPATLTGTCSVPHHPASLSWPLTGCRP